MKNKLKILLTAAVMMVAAFVLMTGAYATEARSGNVTGSVVNIRETPSASGKWLMSVAKGEKVIILDQTNNWFKVGYNGTVGYMMADYVEPVCDDEGTYGSGVVTGSFVYLRAEPSSTSLARATLSEGLNVQIKGIKDGWYHVKYGSFDGYMHPDYVEPIKVATTTRVTRTTVTEGQKIVNIAKKYIGTPYVWGGSTPKGFDCSGLVTYVYNEWAGYKFKMRTRLYLNGTSISYANLTAGDLVFFDTAGRGNITHVGIYVGNGQFIHAPKPGTKVRIESMASGSYYARTFVCARRIA